ncbi:hypothetical protein LOTGIDRAFT_157180 [Lottia gigantea]|uniref:Uncharacterized protein n=1 Tax=Lottia gigantea TaxID=225164 RepID=V4CIN4_LOTGI|nr:hypothetical protein LOTGIDRAFT_157180 [Lottia gigantea]ESP02040.1 hypothetical protein LOTGIDRAFT_157180 [Lottia gigantea]
MATVTQVFFIMFNKSMWNLYLVNSYTEKYKYLVKSTLEACVSGSPSNKTAKVLDLKKNEMEWVLNHLGHSMEVHKIHYRHTSDVIERAKVAKLLLMQDNDKIGAFQHMSLNEIQMEGI